MGKPSAADPLGQRPDPADFGDMINGLIDARIEQRLTGRTDERFNDIPDAAIAMELIARGWAAFIPAGNKR